MSKWLKKGSKLVREINGVTCYIYKPKYQQCFVLDVNGRIIYRNIDRGEVKKYAKRLYGG